MRKLYCFTALSIIVVMCISCLGCLRAQPFVPHQYLLEITIPNNKLKSGNKVLEISRITIVPQFASLGLVYRTSGFNYLIDYYNIFFTPPDQQINKIMVDYLRAKNIFSYVANNSEFLHIDYVLVPEITALYADYRHSKQPLAIIAIDCSFFSANELSKPLFHKLYSIKTPLVSKDSEGLIKAWNQGLQRILLDLSLDLRSHVLKKT